MPDTAQTGTQTPEGQTAGDCEDGADNDGDGVFDCNDTGCAGSPACTSTDPTDVVQSEPGAEVLASFPFLSMAAPGGAEKVFPTHLAHLMGGDVSQPWWRRDFSCITVKNTGESKTTFEVAAELVGYSDAVSELVELTPGQSGDVCLSPVPNLEKLYALNSEANSQARIQIKNASTGGLVAQATESVRVATRRNIWFDLSGQPARSAVATLVRPDADAIVNLLDDVVERSAFGGTVGVGGYRAEAGDKLWPVQTLTIQAGGYAWWPMFVEAGRSVVYGMRSSGADSWGYVMSAADFDKLQAGNEFLVYWQEELDTEKAATFTAPTTGWYYLVAYNYSSFLSESVTWNRTMTRADNVLDYLRIIYEHLQDYGINYINVPGTFFESAQECLLPDEVLISGGGNCIDGTMVFASILEQLGVRPIITFVPGHAFISIDSGPSGSNIIWSLETTMLGSGASFNDALNAGIQQRQEADFDGAYSRDLYIDSARQSGLLPMP